MSASNDSAADMSRSRAAAPTVTPVPALGDPDRKRILNVLAQRRYRRRKRERIAELETALNKAQLRTPSFPAGGQYEQDKSSESTLLTQFVEPTTLPTPATSENSNTTSSDRLSEEHDEHPSVHIGAPILPDEFLSSLPSDQIPLANEVAADFSSANLSLQDFPDLSDVDFTLLASQQQQQQQQPDPADVPLDLSELRPLSPFLPPQTCDPSTLFTPSSSSPSSATVNPPPLLLPSHPLAPPSPTRDTALQVPVLHCLRAFLEIATRLQVIDALFDPTFRHVLPATTPALCSLPPQFRPTPAQQAVPHHPFIDILPWPAVRTKLVCMFAQPPARRPPGARDDGALLALAYDLDDEAEGVRISGEDGLDGRNWEVGEVVYRNWWWALDREVVENSNRLRRRRGAERLSLG